MIKNIIANYIGRFWSILSNFLFIPLYIRFLGLESYSVISFSLVIVGIMAILDAGLTVTLSKEFASKKNSDEDKLKLFKTLETCYFIIGALIIILFLSSAYSISHKWLNLKEVSPEKVSTYLKVIGIGTAFQFLGNFYAGGLLGLEKQVRMNMFQIAWGIARNGLVILPLLIWPTLLTFFIWQSCTTIIYVLIIRTSLIRTISAKTEKTSFLVIERDILNKIWRFAGGILLISIVGAVNSQMDKLAISKLLPIEELGYYTLAFSLTQILVIIVNPIATATLPRFTSLYSEKKNNEALILFNRIFLFASILVFSVSTTLFIYSKDLIFIWTGNKSLAEHAAPFVPFLALGTGMLALAIIPYNVALANTYTRLNNIMGITSLVITIPGYWFMTSIMGPIGAAITMGGVQLFVTCIYLYFINVFFLKDKSFLKILLKDIILPFSIALAVSFCLSLVSSSFEGKIVKLLWIGFSIIITVCFSFILLLNKSEKKYMFKTFRVSSNA